MTEIVTFFIVVACGATLYVHGLHDINDAADAAAALKPLAGDFASILFAVGLVNAALLSAAILPLATTYNICEGLGFESGINQRPREAPAFYVIYSLLVVFGAGIVLIPRIPLIKLIILSQVANGVLLPFVLFYMLKLVNRPDLMGRHTNSKVANAVAITTSIIMVVLTVAMVWTTVTGT
jgi:Mn2+/Fe2+ NRAMP family transporter